MGTLNPDIPAPDLKQALDDAARSLSTYGKRVLAPEVLLLTLVRGRGFTSYTVLEQLAAERGFKLGDLEREVEALVKERNGRSADFDYVSADNRHTALSDEMLVVLDEGRTIAQSMNEIYVGTVHALAAMSQRGVSTAGLLQRHGVTPTVLSSMLADSVLSQSLTTVDLVNVARLGGSAPVYYRDALLRDLLNLLSVASDRHVILLGQTGVGRRSLVLAMAQLMAEGKGPAGLDKLVQIGETALLDNPLAAVQAGLRAAAGGILFLPNIQRFFGSYGRADFAKATKSLQKALLDGDVVIIGTTTEADYNERMASEAAIAEHVHLLRVPEPDEHETAAILAVHKPQLEAEYGIEIADKSLPAAARLARRYVASTPLPASAMQLLHRACALVRIPLYTRDGSGDGPTDGLLDDEDVTLAASLMTGIPASKLGADERSRYARMVEHMHERIIGQEEAVLAVSRAVKTGACRAEGSQSPHRLLPVSGTDRRRQDRAGQSAGRLYVWH